MSSSSTPFLMCQCGAVSGGFVRSRRGDMDKVQTKISSDIAKVGWSALGVFADKPGQTNWTYSIGFWESLGHPEVMIMGLDSRNAHGILHGIYEIVKEGGAFVVGEY